MFGILDSRLMILGSELIYVVHPEKTAVMSHGQGTRTFEARNVSFGSNLNQCLSIA